MSGLMAGKVMGVARQVVGSEGPSVTALRVFTCPTVCSSLYEAQRVMRRRLRKAARCVVEAQGGLRRGG